MFTRLAGIVALAMARRALDHRLRARRRRASARPSAGRRCRCPSAITGPPEPQVATQPVGRPATPRSTVKPFFSRMSGDVFRGLDLLEAELAEAEQVSFISCASLARARRPGPRCLSSAIFSVVADWANGCVGWATEARRAKAKVTRLIISGSCMQCKSPPQSQLSVAKSAPPRPKRYLSQLLRRGAQGCDDARGSIHVAPARIAARDSL